VSLRLRFVSLALAVPGAAVLWTLHAGKDLNWDLLHYHLYVAHAHVAGRLEQDFFAASAQSYLNPIGHLPFYAAVMAGWHSVLVAALFAAFHSVSVLLLYRIGLVVLAPEIARRRLLAGLGAALGAASAVFLASLGTSFLDPLLAPTVLGALLVLAIEARRSAQTRPSVAFAAGALLGTAAALKYTNLVFLPAALAAVAASGVRGAGRLCAALAGGAAVSFAALAGSHLVHLWREYANPVFPLFNAWFRSPDFAPINFGAERFRPQTTADALLLPLRMASPESLVYTEMSAPDLRFATVVVLGAVALGRLARRPGGAQTNEARRPARLLLVFFALSFVAWVATSANGRYGIPLLLLVGPVVALVAAHALPAAAARVGLAVLLVAQASAIALAAPARWYIADRWSARWFPYELPERALREPALYVSIETLAMSTVVPWLHPASSFVNLRGQVSVPHGAPRLERLVAQHRNRVRALGRALRLGPDGRPRAEAVETYDLTLTRYGFRVDPEDCFGIAWKPDGQDTLSSLANRIVGRFAGARELHLTVTSCALRRATPDPSETEAEQRASALFDRIERLCPGVFRGQTALTERFGREEWSRSYAGLEARLETRAGRLALVPYFRLTHLPLGTIEAWERGVPPELERVCRKGFRW